MSTEREQLEAGIRALEAQRAVLGDAVVDASIAGLRARLARRAPADAAVAQALRQVSILFLDIVGSTGLSESLEPEDVQHVIDGLLARCTQCIAARGGRVLQYAGDNLLAAFGAEQASEDDAERALLAGLDLLAIGRAQGAEVLRDFGLKGFDVRVGVHTGSVLLGGGVDAEGSIRGLAVNVAARLEQLAPPGALRISRETWLHVRGLFDMEEQPPLAVKGLQEPVATFLVKRALPRSFGETRRGIAGLATPLIGREAELGRMTGAYGASLAGRHLQAITVMAEAGQGKSRLLAEFELALRSHPAPPRVWRARAHPHSRQQAFGLIRDLFCRAFRIDESDDQATAQAKLQQGLAGIEPERSEESAALIGQLIGLDFSASPHVAGILQDGRQLRQRATHRAGELLRRQASAADGGVVVLFDDLHWADEPSLDFIERVAQQAAQAPVMLLCGARPALRDHRPAWGEGLLHHQWMELAALPDNGAALADALLASMEQPPAALRELLLQQSEGNAFYMEELLLMLMADGVVDASQRPWTVHLDRLGALRVPTTLTGVLQARLDSLPGADRHLLQQASVVGPVFWNGALRALRAGADEPEAHLAALEQRGTVQRRERAVFSGTQEYGFRHHLLHQVTYDTVLRRDRQPLHRRTAQWLVAVAGERIGEHAALIAQHFERGGDHEQAVVYLQRAASAAMSAAAPAVALGLLDRALGLLPDGPSFDRFEVNGLRLQALNVLGLRERTAATVAEQSALAEALNDERCRARAKAEQCCLLVVTGQFAKCVEVASEAQRLAEALGEPAVALMSQADLGHALMSLDRLDEAAEVLVRAAGMAHELGRTRVEIVALNRLASVYWAQGRVEERLHSIERAIEVAERSGNLRLLAGMRSNLGHAEALWGQFERADALITEALQTQRAIGDRASEGYSHWQLMSLRGLQGQPAEGLQHAEWGLAIASEVRDRGLEIDLLVDAALLAVDHGALDQAEAWLGRCDALQIDSPVASAPSASLPRACLAFRRGWREASRDVLLEWVDWLESGRGGMSGKEGLHMWQACQLLRELALPAPYARVLARAWQQMHREAAVLPPARRASYLHRVPCNRAIAEAWAALHPEAGAAP